MKHPKLNPLMLLILSQAWMFVKQSEFDRFRAERSSQNSDSNPSDLDDDQDDVVLSEPSATLTHLFEKNAKHPYFSSHLLSDQHLLITANKINTNDLGSSWGDERHPVWDLTDHSIDWQEKIAEFQDLLKSEKPPLALMLRINDADFLNHHHHSTLFQTKNEQVFRSPSIWVSHVNGDVEGVDEEDASKNHSKDNRRRRKKEDSSVVLNVDERLTDQLLRSSIQVGWSWWCQPPSGSDQFQTYLLAHKQALRFWFTHEQSDQWVWPWADIVVKKICEKMGKNPPRYWIPDQRQKQAWLSLEDRCWEELEKMMGGPSLLNATILAFWSEMNALHQKNHL